MAAEQGNSDAQFNLGLIYANGRGVPKDDAEVVKWYRLAAEQGHADAQNSLGVAYANGAGVLKDEAEAIKWFRLASSNGNDFARLNLADRYANAEHILVPHSKVVAYALFNLASLSNENARSSRDQQGALMGHKDIIAAQALTRELQTSKEFLKALDQAASKHKVRPQAPAPQAKSSAANDRFPAAPAKRPGVVSCNTNCVNASCFRTYDDGRRVKFQAKQVFDPFSRTFKFDSGSC